MEDSGWLSGKDVAEEIPDLQTQKISEVPPKSESGGPCASGDSMAQELTGQRPRLWNRNKSGEGKKEKKLKVIVKTKADSFLPRKRLEPQQRWRDKLG